MNIKTVIKTPLSETIAFLVGFHLLVLPAALFARSVCAAFATEAERAAPEIATCVITNVELLLRDEAADTGADIDAGQR